MSSDPLVDVAWELYDLPPSEFTAARNARAKELRSDAPDVAKRVAELRRPSPAAWIVGQLVRHRADRLAQVLELGAELREAQQDLDASALSQLTRDRRALTAALAKEGAALAAARGVNAPAATLDEVSQTLQAAMADAAAADAVTSGRLIRALEVVGFDPVDLDGAVAGPAPDGSAPARTSPPDELAARRARRAAEKAAREAEEALERSRRTLADARAAVAENTRRTSELTRRRDELRAELGRVERDLERATAESADLEERAAAADRQHVDAERALAEARSALDT